MLCINEMLACQMQETRTDCVPNIISGVHNAVGVLFELSWAKIAVYTNKNEKHIWKNR